MTLLYIQEAEVACLDLERTALFLQDAYGLEELERDSWTVLLGAPGAIAGRIRLRRSSQAGRPADAEPAQVWDLGPRLLGIYSRDLERTSELVEGAGGAPRPIVSYKYGDATMSEMVAAGPDNVWWTIPQAVPGRHRASGAYASDAARLHSELHTVVLVVDDHDAALAFFQAGGLSAVFDGTMKGADFEELVGMPEGAALRLSFLGGPEHLPARFELMSFEGTPTIDRSGDPLGITTIVYVCDDLKATQASLVAAGGEETDDGILVGPVGIRIRLVTA